MIPCLLADRQADAAKKLQALPVKQLIGTLFFTIFTFNLLPR
jgi:hypothetical protein